MTDLSITLEELLERLSTDPSRGLTQSQARERLESYGENRLAAGQERTLVHRFFAQLRDPMVLILLAAAAVSFVVALLEPAGEFLDPAIIVAIVLLNASLGVLQESRAERALAGLRELSAPQAKVLRQGMVELIPALEVVPGDIVLLEAGDQVPADGRLLECASLRCDESILTGESLPVEKDPHACVPAQAPLGDRVNMAFGGCLITHGRGKLLITRTGMQTEMGKIAGLLEKADSPLTPLQQRLSHLGKVLGLLALGICALIFVLGLLQGMPPLTIFMTAVSLAVAAIPEGLTAVVTVVLALGVQRMVKQNAVIRRLAAVETLGSASVICSDKTGTLTQNRMTVRRLWPAAGDIEEVEEALSEPSLRLLRLGILCNDGRVAEEEGRLRHYGDPTETAIVAAALQWGIDKEETDRLAPRVGELPFDSSRKRMTTLHQVNGRILAVTKGGLDALLPLCTSGDTARAVQVNEIMAGEALRVLAVGCRELEAVPPRLTGEELERDLTFVGLIGMIDPPREESFQAVSLCHRAGIRTVMITGDHVATASTIAFQLGILERPEEALSGAELAAMTDEELARDIDRYRVYARVSPEDKIRIVRAWQQNGQVVAMTGDGVNDAPALKAADIGCAMGIAGTEVAKGAADMVLTDDNFSTIVEAVRSGRGIYENITRTVQFLLGSNLGEVFAVLVAMLLGWGAPLLAIHLLLINVVTDALPALALGVEPADPDLMERPPIAKSQGFFADGLGLAILLQGFLVGMLTLGGYVIGRFVPLSTYHPPSPEAGMTMAFLVLALAQLVQAFNCRSRKSLFQIGVFGNSAMNKAFLISLAVVLLICLFPPLEELFHMVDLSMRHWLWVLLLSLLPLAVVELGKAVLRLQRAQK